MTDDEPAKRSWLKTGCLGLLAVFGGLVVVAMIGNALTTPEQRERMAAERKAAKAAEALEEQRAAEAEAKAEIDAAEKVTAMQLWAAYSQNEVATQAALKGRSVLITGTIDAINLDFMDEPVVSLATGNQFQSVQLDFDEKDIEATSALRKGQEVTALCREVSEVAGVPMLDGCTLR